ncbi:MAG: endo-1,4-beta-xylanase [Clostridiales Family XIII bacterium]|jgi:hypothetical protein|nr:endo-1,4-beta-xylanase [Clostridiales Family XIII bacterium]
MKTPIKLIISTIAALVIGCSAFTANVFAVDYSLPSLWKEYEDYFIMGTFGVWNSDQAMYHYRTNSPSNALKLDAQIGNNNTNSLSRQAYVAKVAEINAMTLTDAEKDAMLKAANENVVLVASPPVLTTLNQIRANNEGVPENEKKVVRAHTLVWHGGQQPNYFFCNGFIYNAADPDWASPETMLARLENYVKQMMQKYAPYNDIIYSWDVVNEPLDDYTGQVRNAEGYQVGQWGRIFRDASLDDDPDARLKAESIYIQKAFEYAKKWSLEYGADWKLYLNDFQDSNKPYEPKMSQTIKLLGIIRDYGEGRYEDADGNPVDIIDGYGLQARLAYAYPTIDILREQIEESLKVIDEISISESDIRSDFITNPDYNPLLPSTHVNVRGAADPNLDWPVGSGSWALRSANNGNTLDTDNSPVKRNPLWTPGAISAQATAFAIRPEIMRAQADFAADWMDLLIEFKDNVIAYQWDGTRDNSTFNSNVGAHIWDGNQNEKYSFFAIIGAPNRDKMRQVIESGPGDGEANLYTISSWGDYAEAKTVATTLAGVRIYDIEGVNDVKEATAELQEAIDNLVLRGTFASIDQTTRVVLKVGDVRPLLYSTNGSSYEFVSSNPSVVSVSADGELTAIKSGNATITLRLLDDSGIETRVAVMVGR